MIDLPFIAQTTLFLPEILRHHLVANKSLAALHLAQQYEHLEYFAHALEVLLHHVLDEEVDMSPPPSPASALLPRVLSLLSSFKEYLDIVVQCTRKTEVRSWRTLFAYLPPPQELFEESLQRGSLKTAGGYLLVLHTFDELATASEQSVRLLSRAMREEAWELCKELARFLAALDETGDTLREALRMAHGRLVAGNHQGEDGVGGASSSSLVARLGVPPKGATGGAAAAAATTANGSSAGGGSSLARSSTTTSGTSSKASSSGGGGNNSNKSGDEESSDAASVGVS